jgi:hypothetical protein
LLVLKSFGEFGHALLQILVELNVSTRT